MSDTAASPSPESGNVPPATTSPSPLRVGINFVKAYYQTLTTQPDMISRFYMANSSYLSHGEGSKPTNPEPLEQYNLSLERWGCTNKDTMRFELEHGAIDAQFSVNAGILLVVTGQVIFKSATGADGDQDTTSGTVSRSTRKAFVHTFFLAKHGKNYAVHNDVLRFLAASLTPTESGSTATNSEEGVVTDGQHEKEEKKEDTVVVSGVDEPQTTTAEDLRSPTAATLEVKEDDAPGGGVEESKEEASVEEETTGAEVLLEVTNDAKVADGSKENSTKNQQSQQQQSQQKQQPAFKPVPGSWASLVASGGSAPNTPSRKPAQSEKMELATEVSPEKEKNEKKDFPEVSQDTSAAPNTTSNTSLGKGHSQQQQRPKRDPDNTLVIKNLSENVKEQDMVNMFKPFAVQTNSKITAINLNHHRGLAFVDYDSVAPVMAALKKHAETPFQWNGKILEVDQKTLEVRARRKAAGMGHYQSGSTNNNGFRGAGGGRDQYRRGGDRGGRRSGNRGGGRGGR